MTTPVNQRPRCLELGLLLVLIAPCIAIAGDPQRIHADGFEGSCATLLYTESFDTNQGIWPAPWVELAGSADLADVSGGESRLRPVVTGYSLARMYADIPTRDVEVRFSTVLEDASAQGTGFYVRQNGGHLNQTMPRGKGFAVFVEGTFRGMPGVGVWREENGNEIQIAHSGAAAPSPQTGERIRVRFRVHQLDAGSTLLQAKIWPDAALEPLAWQVSATHSQPDLQNISGGIAIDSWNVNTGGTLSVNTRVDDIEVESLCNPIASRGTVETVSESFQFTEGPLWRGDHLLFSDIDADTIFRLDEPSGISVFRSPSARANGLALDSSDRLLAAEHENRRLSLTGADGIPVTFADRFNMLRFNSPNDIVVADDGTVYFTDPDYGLAVPADREIPFNGLFRVHPGGVSAEWQGQIGSNQPNGVALSPDQLTLYATDSQAGTLRAWTRMPDGTLTDARVLAGGLFIPDGLCIDDDGNILVSTWSNTIELFTPDGARWGAIPVPFAATNCAFGGDERRTLYVTAQQGLYRVRMPIPGSPY